MLYFSPNLTVAHLTSPGLLEKKIAKIKLTRKYGTEPIVRMARQNRILTQTRSLNAVDFYKTCLN